MHKHKLPFETSDGHPETLRDALRLQAEWVWSPILGMAFKLFATFVCLRILTSSLNGGKGKALPDIFFGYLSRWGSPLPTAANFLWYGALAALVVYITTLPRGPVERVVNRILFVLFVLFIIWYATRPSP